MPPRKPFTLGADAIRTSLSPRLVLDKIKTRESERARQTVFFRSAPQGKSLGDFIG